MSELSESSESLYNDVVSEIPQLTNLELDQQLETAAIESEKAEMLVCCYLSAVGERRAYRDFGYSNVTDYAEARFGFRDRKTRYLVSLGRKIQHLPKIRAALASGKIGWCKATRLASVAAPDNEVMWLESALSLTVRQVEQRIKDGTDTLASVLHLPLTEDRRILWENALEIYRRRAGAEISPVEAFELMVAEVIAEWAHYLTDTETPAKPDEPEEPETEAAMPANEGDVPATNPPGNNETETGPVFPWVEAIDTGSIGQIVQPSLFESELAVEAEFAKNPDYKEMRLLVLERDGWKCTYPGCGARAQLHVHHIQYRSHGVCHAPWNLTVVCNFHHDLIHKKHIGVKGRAPHALEWTPPKLMQAVLDRRRNRPSIWLGELDVREWSLESRAAETPVAT
ncbi:MAG: hypothetical protein BMS9Abin37_0191 [Acidobacteriota bacterium]|nr:MAG: hypothetical protein BMS9Abin37_0191 [Acidobacteriota bacterium]